MQQHPVPQQISSYQFHLVGDMTLKQFFEVGGGVLVAILIYSSALPGLFKWPLIAISVILGAALAFFPLEERPLEQWIIAFFRSIYSPTLFYWAPPVSAVKYFADEPVVGSVAPQVPTAPDENRHVQKHGFLSRLEEGEQALLDRFSGIIPQHTQQTNDIPEEEASALYIAQPQVVPAQPVAVQSGPANEKVPPIAPEVVQHTEEVTLAPTFTTNAPDSTTTAQAAHFSPEAAPPLPPTQANIIVGQVMDATGKIIEGAILEIKDMQGRPVRALRSNRVGHFQIVTPLSDGPYEMEVDKQGFTFDPVTLSANGSIIPPIAVTAKPVEEGVHNA